MSLPDPSTALKNDDEGAVNNTSGGAESVGGPGNGDDKNDEHDEGEEDESDEEPSLKYERIVGAIPDLLKKDSASSLAIVNRTMVCYYYYSYFLPLCAQLSLSRLWAPTEASSTSST